MSIKSWAQKLILGRAIAPVVSYLKGKKTAIGAVSLLLWIAIYAMPAFGPNYNWVVQAGTTIRDTLQSNGIVLDNSLFNVGTGMTVIGLVGKVMDFLKKDKQ